MWTGFNCLNIIMDSVEGREFLDKIISFVKKMFLVGSPNNQIPFRSTGGFPQFLQGMLGYPLFYTSHCDNI